MRVVCLMGPTASGKTDLAIAWARRYPFEIINVDSAQIYQGMDIGSGKPDESILAEIPHHLMGFLDPKQAYSAAQFCQDAISIIQDIQARGSWPLLVGGTMLYFKALQQGLSPLPERDEAIRQQLHSQWQQQGLDYLYQQLTDVDPQAAEKIGPTDPQRILRALEVYQTTGKPLSYWHQQPSVPTDLRFQNIALMPVTTSRAVLHARIEQRFDHMLAQGLVEEVEKLYARGDLDLTMPSMRAVGYRQVWQYLAGDISYSQMRDQAIAATRQLAKRQMTWLRHFPHTETFDFCEQVLYDSPVFKKI